MAVPRVRPRKSVITTCTKIGAGYIQSKFDELELRGDWSLFHSIFCKFCGFRVTTSRIFVRSFQGPLDQPYHERTTAPSGHAVNTSVTVTPLFSPHSCDLDSQPLTLVRLSQRTGMDPTPNKKQDGPCRSLPDTSPLIYFWAGL